MNEKSRSWAQAARDPAEIVTAAQAAAGSAVKLLDMVMVSEMSDEELNLLAIDLLEVLHSVVTWKAAAGPGDAELLTALETWVS